jgi:hypothetical protein
MTTARILADSVCNTRRLTTFEVVYQRFIHAEVLTHRALSRNSSSSRALPIDKMLANILADPAMPIYWGTNKSGMQAGPELQGAQRDAAIADWLSIRDRAITDARTISANHNLHKQLVNRIVEPWMWITVIVTATDLANFFAQRRHEDAQPEIRLVADAMWVAYTQSVPTEKSPLAHDSVDGWHLPLILPDEIHLPIEQLKQISVARSARVSYLTHDHVRSTDKDLELYARLLKGGANGHWSPFEHVATPLPDPDAYCGNFRGWRQFRKAFPQENIEQASYTRSDVPEIDVTELAS